MVVTESTAESTIITLLPNRSASWRQTRRFLYLMCGTILAIGAFWALRGVWVILPFSGLEAGLLAWLMYRVSRATYQRQQITVARDGIEIKAGINFPRRHWQLARESTYLAVDGPRRPLEGPVLRLVDQERALEVGAFLNAEDKQVALDALRRSGLRVVER